MGCFQKYTAGIAKYILIGFNLVIFLCANVLITLAIIARAVSGGVDIMSLHSLTIAVAVIIAVIALFGCCGAFLESSCLLVTYAIILLVIFVLQLVLGVLAFVAVRNEGAELSDFVRDHLANLYDNRDQTISTDSLDEIHTTWRCCGLDGPSGSEVANGTQIMTSCCEESVTICTVANAYSERCVSALTQFLKGNVRAIGIVAVAFGVVELLAAIFAFLVRNNAR